MGMFVTRVVGTLLGAAVAATMLSGCKFFDIGNPLLPKARPVAFPEPTMVNVEITYRQSDKTYQFNPTDVAIKIRSLAGDASPGVIFHGYTAEYFDQTGLPIASLLLSKVNFGVSAYLAPATQLQPAEVEMTLPIYNQQVAGYGLDQVFVFRPQAALNRQLIHTINCRATLLGTDDNFNEIEVPVSVPIRFTGFITE